PVWVGPGSRSEWTRDGVPWARLAGGSKAAGSNQYGNASVPVFGSPTRLARVPRRLPLVLAMMREIGAPELIVVMPDACHPPSAFFSNAWLDFLKNGSS